MRECDHESVSAFECAARMSMTQLRCECPCHSDPLGQLRRATARSNQEPPPSKMFARDMARVMLDIHRSRLDDVEPELVVMGYAEARTSCRVKVTTGDGEVLEFDPDEETPNVLGVRVIALHYLRGIDALYEDDLRRAGIVLRDHDDE